MGKLIKRIDTQFPMNFSLKDLNEKWKDFIMIGKRKTPKG